MNVILSLIVSLAMLFGGVGELPAVPETASVYTVRNISVSCGDESVDLAPELVLTTALGSDLAEASFKLISDGSALLPVSGRLEADKLSFSLAETGKAYSISNDVLLGELGGETTTAFAYMEEIVSLLPQIAQIPEAEINSMNEQLYAALFAGIEPDEVEIEVNGETIAATSYSGEVTEEGLFSILTLLENSENEAIQRYMQMLLELVNMDEGTQYASFSDAFATEYDAEEPVFSLPLDVTIAYQDDLAYEQVYCSTELDGAVIDVDATTVQQGGTTEMTMNIYSGNEVQYMSCSVYAYTAEDGAMSVSYDVSGGSTISYETMDEAGETVTSTTQEDTYIFMNLSSEVDENGLRDSNFALDASNVSFSAFGDEEEYSEEGFSIEGQFSELAEEDGSISTDCYLSLSVPAAGFTADLSFQLNRAEVPYEDAFAGKKILALTAEDLSGETESAAMNQLTADAMSLLSDVMLLSADESVVALGELGAALEEGVYVETESDAYEADDYSYEEYTAEYPETLDDAYAAYGYAIPELAIPEGFVPSYVSAMEGYIGIDYEKGEETFSVTFYPNYNETETFFLQPDGSLVASEGRQIGIAYNDDGSVYYADITTPDFELNIYCYSATFSLEDVQAMFAPLA